LGRAGGEVEPIIVMVALYGIGRREEEEEGGEGGGEGKRGGDEE